MPVESHTVAKPMPLPQPFRSLRILIVGEPGYTRAASFSLERAPHTLVHAKDLEEATEVLLVQSFDAILISPRMPLSEIEEFAGAVRQLDDRHESSTRTTLLFLGGGTNDTLLEDRMEQALRNGSIDGVVEESLDPDALTLAIARLAAAVSVDKATAAAAALAPELPVLDIEQLREQVAFDDELLAELIELYISERGKQSPQMQKALAAGDYEGLSRVAHTIKGSLASLHASAARAIAQSLESAAHNGAADECPDLLAALEEQLDRLDLALLALRRSLD